MNGKILKVGLIATAALVLLQISSTGWAQSSITSVSPTSGDQGETLDIKILGDNTDFTQGLSTPTFSGDGITVNTTTVSDSEHLVTNITIDAGATSSARDVNVLTGAETPTPLTGGFTVKAPAPTVTSISPDSGTDDGIAFITDLAGTNFVDGAVVKLRKAGETDIDGESVTIVSAERITCDFDLSGADDGDWDVYVENPDGQNATLQDGFEVESSGSPAMKFTKSGPDEASTGDVVTYSFEISNTGDVPLLGVVVTDSLVGNINIGTVSTSESITTYQTYTIKEDDPNPLINTATASGHDSAGIPVSDTNSHSIDIVAETIDLQKTGPTKAKRGETITYTFTVTNKSGEDLANVEVTDALFGADWSNEIGTLAVSEVATFTQTYDVTDANTFPITNTATVTGVDAFGLQATDTASWSVTDGSSSGSCSLGFGGDGNHTPTWLMLLIPLALLTKSRRRSGSLQ